jgi:deoxyribose-phosphate aldolase
MEKNIEDYLIDYRFPFKPNQISEEIEEITSTGKVFHDAAHLKLIFGLLDLTSLNVADNVLRIRDICRKVNQFPLQFPGIPGVAAICVYPSLVSEVKSHLSIPKVRIASVAGGFPSSQTALSLKVLECRMAVADGAGELDVVIPVGKFVQSDYQGVFKEIAEIKHTNPGILLKVILETGALITPDSIYKASWLAMEAGADFIKTSTGKFEPAASPEAVFVMAYAIQHFFKKTGRKVGLKPAGGVNLPEQALVYFSIVRKILGEPWLNPSLFRIGASRLANSLLAEIQKLEGTENPRNDWF